MIYVTMFYIIDDLIDSCGEKKGDIANCSQGDLMIFNGDIAGVGKCPFFFRDFEHHF